MAFIRAFIHTFMAPKMLESMGKNAVYNICNVHMKLFRRFSRMCVCVRLLCSMHFLTHMCEHVWNVFYKAETWKVNNNKGSIKGNEERVRVRMNEINLYMWKV